MRPTVRIKLVGEKSLFEARSNHWSTFWVRSGWAVPGENAVALWPVAGGSPSTVLPEGVTWKTLRHFLQTRRVWIFSLGARPAAPQAGHSISNIGIALLESPKHRPRIGRCAFIPISLRPFPPLAKGGLGGVVPARPVTRSSHALSLSVLSHPSREAGRIVFALQGSRITPPTPPSQGGERDRSLATSFHPAQQKHASRNRPSSLVKTNFAACQHRAGRRDAEPASSPASRPVTLQARVRPDHLTVGTHPCRCRCAHLRGQRAGSGQRARYLRRDRTVPVARRRRNRSGTVMMNEYSLPRS